MTLDRLGHAPLRRVQLHRTLNFECVLSWLTSCWVGGYTDENQPSPVGRYSVVDDLIASERSMTIENLAVPGYQLCPQRPVQSLTFDGDA
jgi:hypothetical protein